MSDAMSDSDETAAAMSDDHQMKTTLGGVGHQPFVRDRFEHQSYTPKNRQLVNLIGKRFKRLTVISYAGSQLCGEGTKKRACWLCKCDCGNLLVVPSKILRNELKGSCGCSRQNHGKRPTDELAGFINYYENYKKNATKRRYSFDLTIEQFAEIVLKNCTYCGAKPSNRRLLFDRKANGIDRINNAKGYEVGNVTPCCKICNLAKGTSSLTDFTTWLDRVAKHRGGQT